MEVKIYREPENEALILDEAQLEEYNALALELGLSTPERKEANLCPNVYPILNDAMKKQLKAICPASVPAAKYTRTTIPLEVLKVIKFAKDNELFDELEIWFDDKAPDPMLIGKAYENEEDRKEGRSWRKNSFLLARWGEAALEMPELLALGFSKIRTEMQDNLVKLTKDLEMFIQNPDLAVREFLNDSSSYMDREIYRQRG
jgi:hypothetical protein